MFGFVKIGRLETRTIGSPETVKGNLERVAGETPKDGKAVD